MLHLMVTHIRVIDNTLITGQHYVPFYQTHEIREMLMIHSHSPQSDRDIIMGSQQSELQVRERATVVTKTELENVYHWTDDDEDKDADKNH